MKQTKKSFKIFIGILLIAVGIAAVVFAVIEPTLQENTIFRTLCFVGGGIFVLFGLLTCVIRKKSSTPATEIVTSLDSSGNNVKVKYIPDVSTYDFVNMGRSQSLDEKFAEIARMDQTQFVIYIAKLFSHKGYQVKLTPVCDNFNVDLIAEKMGKKIAVSCVLTDKIVCEENLGFVSDIKNHYDVSGIMVLTNSFFDRTALDFAQKGKVSLVDRNILAEDFMN